MLGPDRGKEPGINLLFSATSNYLCRSTEQARHRASRQGPAISCSGISQDVTAWRDKSITGEETTWGRIRATTDTSRRVHGQHQLCWS